MPSHSSSHPHARHASPSTSSSVKPTGWIRSSSATAGSATKPRVGVLSDRTNLPSSSHTPLKSLQKPPTKTLVASRLAGQTRTPAPSNSTKQQTLSRFFAPNTAPAGPSKSTTHAQTSSPSLDRPRLSSSDTRGAASRLRIPPPEPRSANNDTFNDAFNDDDLEARAACLLRGRFGSVSRSLSTSTSSTPPATVSPPTPPSDEPPRSPPVQTRSRVEHVRPPRSMLPPAEPRTPPRKRPQPNPPSSPFQPTLMAESLSNFTPPAWAKSIDRKLALFQRMAGIQDDVVREQERRQMENELDRAHQRMQGSSPAATKSKRPPTSRQRTSLAKQSEAAPTGRVSMRSEQMPETLLRSPVTNRRIYALETQLVPVKRAALQPASRADKNASEVVQNQPLCARTDPLVAESADATQDESETLPLAWPAEGDDETQPLAWDDADEEAAQIPTEAVQLSNPIGSAGEVPTSDDDDFLTEPGVVLDAAHDSTPVSKRRRVDTQRMAKPSPVSLTSASGAGRFDSVVAALRRQERRQNSGMQLSLDRYVTKPTCKLDSDDDLDVLSDDEVGDETQPLEWTTPVKRPTLQLASSPAAATQLSTSSGASASASEISLPSQTALNDADTQTRTFFERL